MDVEFDAAKDEPNRAKHGVSLELAAEMDFAASLVLADRRFDYGEDRFQALGPISGRLYLLAFAMRGDTLRAISLRKANNKERMRYGKT